MSLPISVAIERYATMSPTEKAQVRDAVFSELSTTDFELQRALDQATSVYDTKFKAMLEAFIMANLADFSAGELSSASAARLRMRQRFAATANAIDGVSGATAVGT